MGFAFEDETGLPVIVGAESDEEWRPVPPLALHIEPESAPALEVDIGDIMLKVQRFADETAEDARRQARTAIADAQVEAASIVARARREADEIATQAVRQIAPDAVTNLCAAIEDFADTNRVLVDELVQLRKALIGPYTDTPVSPSGHLTALPPPAG